MTSITQAVELFQPKDKKFEEVTLLDCNDSFTHNLVQVFLKLGAPVRVFRANQVSSDLVISGLGEYLILSPGPGRPEDAGILIELYQKVQGNLLTLGVCLGMQAINEVLGGKTIPSPIPVHGKTTNISHNGNGIFTNIASPTPVARYHSLMIDPISGLDIQSQHKEVVMAFRIPKLKTVAIQFHPESFMTRDGLAMLTNFLEGRI